jgi:hypothetical protein
MGMTGPQNDILTNLLDQEGGTYTIVTIEYPSNFHDLKTVTRMIESDEHFVDIYNEEGATVESRSFFARQS